MAIPLMAIGAGIGLAADSINRQRQQQQQMQMQQAALQRQNMMLQMSLKRQQDADALNAFGPAALGGALSGFGDTSGATGGEAAPVGKMPDGTPGSHYATGAGPAFETGLHKLTALGIDPEVASGFLGYMQKNESGLNPNALNPTSGASGVAQWLGPRLSSLHQQFGMRPSLEQQFDFMTGELQGPESRTLAHLRAAHSPQEGYNIAGVDYERPGAAALAKAGVRRAAPYAPMPGQGAATQGGGVPVAMPDGSIRQMTMDEYNQYASGQGTLPRTQDINIHGKGPKGEDYIFGKTIPRPQTDASGRITRYADGRTPDAAPQPPGPQYAQAGGQTMTDALPPPPNPQAIFQSMVQAAMARGANPQQAQQAAAKFFPQALAAAKSAYSERIQAINTQRSNRIAGTHLLQTPNGLVEWHPGQPIPPGATTGGGQGGGTQIIETDQGPMIVNRGTGEVRPVQLPGGAHVVGKTGGGVPHNIEVRDAEGKTVYSGAAKMSPEGFVKPDGSPIPIPEGGSASMASTAGGRQAATQIQAIIGSGNELLGELNNLMDLPKTATLGIFQGLQNAPAGEMGEAMKRSLANKFTPEEMTDLNTSFQGVARSLATIEAQGRATGLVGLTEQAKAMAPQAGDSLGNVLRKYATLRQILERGLETVQANRDISPDQKTLMKKMIDEVQKTVPFTVSDVNKWQHGDVESLRSAAKSLGFGGEGGAGGPSHVTSQEDYDKLAPGAQYIGPDGQLRQKGQ